MKQRKESDFEIIVERCKDLIKKKDISAVQVISSFRPTNGISVESMSQLFIELNKN